MPSFHRRPWSASALALTAVVVAATVGAPAAQATATVPAKAAFTAARAAAGQFTVVLDPATFVSRDVGANACELIVDGELTFSGTLAGTAAGTTTAVVLAPCAAATATPPGTYVDVFRFEGVFTGTIGTARAVGALTYAGVTRVGGAIDAGITLRGDRAQAVLRASAMVAVGGTYSGIARAR